MTVDHDDGPSAAQTEKMDRRDWWIVAGLILGTWFVFGQVLTFEFLMWDDEKFVVRHIERLGGLSAESVHWAVTNNENGWRTPLPYLSLFADATLFGLNPAGYHLTNLLIHTASTLLLFVALRWMTAARWASAAAAALFAVHPMHVEPVAWVTGRWELLCGFFWIAGMVAYAGYARRPTPARLATVVLSYVCALASKPMALTFPFALLLLDYWPLCRVPLPWQPKADDPSQAPPARITWRRAVGEKVPLFAVMAGALAISYQAKAGYMASKVLAPFTLGQRALNALQSYATYVIQFAWPDELSFYYPHPVITGGFSTARLLGSAVLLLGITVATVILARRQRFLLVGWLWFLGVLVPSIGLLQVEHHARADRYMYLPLIGLIVCAAWGINWLVQCVPRLKTLTVVLVIGSLLTLAGAARRQASHWRSDRALFEHAVNVDARNFKAWTGLGELATQKREHAVAEACFRKADRIFHANGFHRYLVGRAAFVQHKYPQAIVAFEEALQQSPGLARARRLLAEAHAEVGDEEAARREFERMVRYAPQDPRVYRWFGDYLARTGQYDEALEQYREVLRIDPLNRRVPKLIGSVLNKRGRAEEAVSFYKQYLRKYPRRAEIADELAWVLSTHEDDAVRDGEAAVKIAERLCAASQFGNRYLLDTLAAAYAESGRHEEAVDTARKSLSLAQAAKDEEHITALKGRLVLFRNRQPYRREQRSEHRPVAAKAQESTAKESLD